MSRVSVVSYLFTDMLSPTYENVQERLGKCSFRSDQVDVRERRVAGCESALTMKYVSKLPGLVSVRPSGVHTAINRRSKNVWRAKK